MNFDDINAIYEHTSKTVYPYVKSVWTDVSTEGQLIGRYLISLKQRADTDYKSFFVPYMFDTRLFLEKYTKQCIIYYNTTNPADGQMLFIHQLSPTVHLHSRYSCWMEHNRVHDYTASIIFTTDYDNAIKFVNENYNLRKTGNTENKDLGFTPLKSCGF